MADRKVKIKNLEKLSGLFADDSQEKEAARQERDRIKSEAKKLEDADVGKSDNKSGFGMGWYVVHTYSGYESTVKTSIEKTIANAKPEKRLNEKILEIRIPKQDVVETKAKGKKKLEKKVFPGYVLAHMDPDDNDAWYVVRNTRGVTGYVGPGGKPVPLEPAEVAKLEKEAEEEHFTADFAVGDVVEVVDGTWKPKEGEPKLISTVTKIDMNKGKATIYVEFMGAQRPVELSFSDIKKID